MDGRRRALVNRQPAGEIVLFLPVLRDGGRLTRLLPTGILELASKRE
jgi:hypothetical protein